MSLVTIGDLKNYADWTFTSVQEAGGELVLAGLQIELEAELRRPVEPQTYYESYTVPGSYKHMELDSAFYNFGEGFDMTGMSRMVIPESFVLHLNNSPVTAVDSVTSTSPGPTGTTKTLVEGASYVVRGFGIEFFSGVAGNFRLDVVYEAGLDGKAIDYFKLLILRAAIREMQNMHDDVVGIKDLETRNVAALETGFTEQERLSIKKFRRFRG